MEKPLGSSKPRLLVMLEDYLLRQSNNDPSFAMRVIVKRPVIQKGDWCQKAEFYTPEIEGVMSIEWDHPNHEVVTFVTRDANVTINADEVVGFYS